MFVSRATRTLLRGKGLEQKLNFFVKKMSFLSRVQSKLVQRKGITEESLRTELPVTGNHWGLGSQTSNRWAIFEIFSKNCQFNVIQIKFCSFLEPFKRTIHCMAFYASCRIKLLSPFNHPFTYRSGPKHILNVCVFGLNFLNILV